MTLAGLSSAGDENGEARFFNPQGVAVDTAGNVYVADTDNHTIRKVTATGVVSTLAGTAGERGSVNGTAGAARFNAPKGVAVDSAGNVYVADSGNHILRKVTSAGVVTTLAGSAGQSGRSDGTGSSAQFNNPFGVAVDRFGNIYVADTDNHTIRRVTSAGVVTTLAGAPGQAGDANGTGGAARFNYPLGLAVDSTGNLYVADTSNHVIRKVTGTGVVTTLAGSPGQAGSTDGTGTAARFIGPIGVAVDSAGVVYVGDTSNQTIRKVTGAGAVTTLAGSTGEAGGADGSGSSARFRLPRGLAVDAAGNAYVSDSGNHTIRKIAANGWVSTFAGTSGRAGGTDGTSGASRFENPVDLAVDRSGNVYVVEGAELIYKVAPGGQVTVFAGSEGQTGIINGIGAAARFDRLRAVAVDSSDNVYVVETGIPIIRKVTQEGVVTTVASGAPLNNIFGVTVDSDGTIYGSNRGSVIRITSSGAKTTLAGEVEQIGSQDGTGSAARFAAFGPHALALDNGGNIVVADAGNHTVRKVTPAGVVTTLAGLGGQSGFVNGTGSAARFNSPTGVTVDRDGNIYVADSSNHVIRKMSPAGVVTTFAGTAGSTGSADGQGAAARFLRPGKVAIDRADNIYVADMGNYTIRKITPAGTVTTLAGTAGQRRNSDLSSGKARFNLPRGVALDEAGNVYVADSANHIIRKVNPGGVVTTLAGTVGVSGRSDGAGAAARFFSPYGVAVDKAGNVFVADTNNHAIRKVSPAGVVTTLAGGGGRGSGGEDGAGNVARFNQPSSVAVDGAGNVYVCDKENYSIRKVTPTGMVTTLAGKAGHRGTDDGTGGSAYFYVPRGITIDGGGNIYVADNQNFSVRKVTAAGVVTTLPTRFAAPNGVAVDSAGNILVLEFSGSIRRISPTGDVTTIQLVDIAGAAVTFSQAEALSVDSAGNIFVAHTRDHTIRKVTAGGVVTTFAGVAGISGVTNTSAGAARFNSPSAVAVGNSRNIYVADRDNHVIRKVDAAGVVTTLAGSVGESGSQNGTGGAAKFSSPAGVATDRAGNIYVADTGNHVIRRVTQEGVVTNLAGFAGLSGGANGAGTTARFNQPFGVAVDSAGNVFVADFANHSIRKITAGGAVTTLAGSTVGQSGSVDGTGAAAQFDSPTAVAVDSAGNVYVSDFANHAIRKVTAAGVVTTLAGTAGQSGNADGVGPAARFSYPSGLAVDNAGNILVGDSQNHVIRRITAAGVVTTLAGAAGLFSSADGTGSAARFYSPLGVAVDGAGNVYIADTGNNTIRTVTATGVVTTLTGNALVSADGTSTAARFLFPNAVALDRSGNAYVADTLNHTIRKIANNGMVTTLAGSSGQSGGADGTAAEARFNYPSGVAVDVSGNVWVADRDNHAIRRVTAAGTVTTLAGTLGQRGSSDGQGSAARFDSPLGVVVDQTGDMIVTDSGNHTIRKVSAAGMVTVLAGSAGEAGGVNGAGTASRFNFPAGIGLDGAGSFYVADRNNHTIRRVTPEGLVTTLAGATGLSGNANGTGAAARFNFPSGVSVDSAGNLLVADRDNHVIRKISRSGVVTTLAGTAGLPGSDDGTGSAAGFRFPSGIAVDANENIYVADTYNHTIRKGTNAATIGIKVDGGQTVAAGGIVTVTVTGVVTAPIGYQWRKDGVPIPGATQSTLTLPNVQSGDTGSYDIVVSYTDQNIVSSPVTLSVVPGPSAYLSNVSVRTTLGSGQTVTVGFAVTHGSKSVLVRAAGPALAPLGITTYMVDPRLELYQGSTRIAENNDWSATLAATFANLGAFPFPAGSKDAAVLQDLNGAYTVQATGTGPGVVLIEGFDAGTGSTVRLGNLSARNRVGTGTDILTAGIYINGTGNQRLLIRAVGPGLNPFGVTGTLVDPKLELYDASNVRIAENDNWDNSLAAMFSSVGAFALAPGSKDSALVATVAAGRGYTIQVSGVNGGTGEALVEVYELP